MVIINNDDPYADRYQDVRGVFIEIRDVKQ